MGPQMEMSSLVLTIQLLGYLILTHTHIETSINALGMTPGWPPLMTPKLGCHMDPRDAADGMSPFRKAKNQNDQ